MRIAMILDFAMKTNGAEGKAVAVVDRAWSFLNLRQQDRQPKSTSCGVASLR
jgi:hypothetical protein